MANVMPDYLRRSARKLVDYLEWNYKKKSHESIYFYTFHKCASSLFGGYVLKNIKGLRHVDYATQIYRGEKIDKIVFEKKGFVYGPLRLSVNPESPVYKKLIEPVSDVDFIRDKIAIFLIRDPRDILISTYYSFGFSHGFSNVDDIRTLQEHKRLEIRNKTIDEYALESAPGILANFKKLDTLNMACNQSVILKYEDMIDHWDHFVDELTRNLDIKETTLAQIHDKSRPREKENVESHRRSGKPGQFRSKLTKETVISLDTLFGEILQRFQYTI